MAVNDLITFRNGTASAWTSANPVLASGEPGYDLTNSILKIGDGVSNWVSLSGIGSSSLNNSSSSVGVRGIISTTGTLSSFAISGGYPVGYLDLFQDGVKLVSDLDFSATDGSNVTLNNSVPSGTILEYLTMASGVTTGGAAISGTVTIPNIGDPSYSSVSLLLHGEGSNGSTTITDNSVSPKTITITGGPQISTAQSKFGSSSVYLPSSSSIATPSSSGFEFGTGDFTVEFWWYVTTLPTSEDRLVNFGGAPNSFLNLTYGYSSNTFTIVNESVAHILTTNQSVSLNQWHHVAYTRSSNTLYLFFNGTLLGSTGVGGISTPSTSVTFSSGPGGSSYFDDIRITKGVARYTSAFTPPSATFPDASSLTVSLNITGSSGSGLSWSSVPSSATASGTAGQIAYDSNYFYIATNTNTWKRSSLTSWPLVSMNYLLVAGGGGGGNGRGGGGGAGGYVYSATSVPVGESISVTVGGGGAGSANSVVAQNGSNSSIALPSETIVAVGGGGGADGLKGLFTGSGMAGASGGSGGGGSGYNPVGDGGSGTVDQGYAGGAGYGSGEPYGGGGGGGAGGVGGSGQTANGGVGKADTMLVVVSAGVDIGGTRYVAGGGGAGSYNYTPGNGGSGGGGNGGNTNADGTNGVANTGGGGGGGGNSANGGSGGSGVVILRCPDSFTATTTGSPSTYVTGGYRYYKFTQNGTITFSVV